MKKQRNCHARSKQKRKSLRLKNYISRIFDKRSQKRMASFKKKGTTITGDAIDVAMPLDASFYRQGNRRDKTLNQRQRRKLAAQTR